MSKFDEFIKWRNQVLVDIKHWPERLGYEALDQAFKGHKTYKSARQALSKYKTELPGSADGSATGLFTYGVTRAIIEEAKQAVNDTINDTTVSEPPKESKE